MRNKLDTQLLIRVPSELKDKLETLAASRGQDVANMIRPLLYRLLEESCDALTSVKPNSLGDLEAINTAVQKAMKKEFAPLIAALKAKQPKTKKSGLESISETARKN